MTQTQHHSPRHGITPSRRCCPWTGTQYISTLGNKHSIQIFLHQINLKTQETERKYIQFSKTPRTWLTKAMTSTRNNFHDCQRRELGSWNDCRDRKATVPQSIASHPKNWELHWKELQTLLPQTNFTMQQLRNKCAGGNERENMHDVHSFERANLCRVLDVARRLEMISRFARSSRYFALWNRQVAPRANRIKRWRSKDNKSCPRKTLSVVQLLSISSRADWCFHSDWYFLSPSGLCFVLCFSTRKSNTYWWRVVWSYLFCFFPVVSMLQVSPFEDLFSTFSTYAAFRVKLPAKDDMACCSELLSLPLFLRFAWNKAPTLNELRRLVALLLDWSG